MTLHLEYLVYLAVGWWLGRMVFPLPRPPFPPPLSPPPPGSVKLGQCPRCDAPFLTRDRPDRTWPWVVICTRPRCSVKILVE